MQKIPIRRDSLDQLQDELKQLKTVERPQIIKAISEAREHGDLSENAEYHAARERQSFIEGRVGELEGVISRAEVIDPSMIDGKTVTFGTTIVVADEDTDEEKKQECLALAKKTFHGSHMCGIDYQIRLQRMENDRY